MTAENLAMTVVGTPRWTPGAIYTSTAFYTIASAVETGDSWTATNILPAQKVQVKSGRSWGADADTNSTPTATTIVGDGTDTDGYLASKTAGGGEQTQELSYDGALITTQAAPASRNLVETLGGTVATAASTGTRWHEVTYLCNDGDRQA